MHVLSAGGGALGVATVGQDPARPLLLGYVLGEAALEAPGVALIGQPLAAAELLEAFFQARHDHHIRLPRFRRDRSADDGSSGACAAAGIVGGRMYRAAPGRDRVPVSRGRWRRRRQGQASGPETLARLGLRDDGLLTSRDANLEPFCPCRRGPAVAPRPRPVPHLSPHLSPRLPRRLPRHPIWN